MHRDYYDLLRIAAMSIDRMLKKKLAKGKGTKNEERRTRTSMTQVALLDQLVERFGGKELSQRRYLVYDPSTSVYHQHP